MRILTIFSRFGTDKYLDSDKKIRENLARQLPDTQRDFVIVDTALPIDYVDATQEVTVLGSSNDDWEFGAWTHVLNYLGNKVYEYEFIHIVTSACYSGYVDFHNFITEEMLRDFKGKPVMIGHVEVYNKPVIFDDVKFQAWLRTSYMIIPPSELKMLEECAYVQSTDHIFSGNPKKPFKENAPLCEQYKDYIHSWLTSPEGTGQGTTWHSQFELTTETLPFYEGKAKAIINEMAFSWRLCGQGCSMVDLTWLHHMYNQKKKITVIPTWYQQLQERRTGHEFIVEG